MAKTTRQAFESALNQWDGLHYLNRYSEPQSDGATAIIYANQIGDPNTYDIERNDRYLEYFEHEAVMIKERHEALGARALLVAGFTRESFERVATDPKISDVTIIGNGNFSGVYDDTSSEDKNRFITWRDISDMTTHLKLGAFTQRTCARFKTSVSMSPPLGAFMMADHRNIFSPRDQLFFPEEYEPGSPEYMQEEAKIVQLSPAERIDYEYASKEFTSDR